MTREEIKRRAELYSALAEGKTIQVQNPDDKWVDIKPEKLNYIPDNIKFRIKPEPTYRPFKDAEECWQEMHNHPDFGWIVSKKGLEFCCICDIFTSTSNSLMITLGIDKSNPYDADVYFDNYTFADGTPFGIKED